MTVHVKSVDLPNGETIGYRERDGGEVPVVLLHGNMTSSKHWDLFFEGMDRRYELYAMDMRGYGNSSYEEPIDSLLDFADDLALFVDELGLDSFHLAGWSTGGAVAMGFAARHPKRVRRLVLLAPVSTRGMQFYEKDEDGEPTDELITTREGIARDPVRSAIDEAQRSGDTEAIREMWDGYIYNEPPEPDRYGAYLEDATTQRNQIDVSYALARFNISDEHNGVAEGTGDAARIEAPTLIVRGEDDNAISHGAVVETSADIGPNAELVEIGDCGHQLFVDALDETLELVEGFLD